MATVRIVGIIGLDTTAAALRRELVAAAGGVELHIDSPGASSTRRLPCSMPYAITAAAVAGWRRG
jgi:hypothetical protein